MSLMKPKDNKKSLYEEWTKGKNKTIKIIADAISSPAKYIAFKGQFSDADIKKVMIALCEQIKKEKEEKTFDIETFTQAQKITRYFADLIKQKQAVQNATNNGKDKPTNNHNGKEKNSDKNATMTNEDDGRERNQRKDENQQDKNGLDEEKDNETEVENNKRKRREEDDNLRIDMESLTNIIDEDNINPTKRKKVISKSYLRDENELPPGWYKIQQSKAKPIVLMKPHEEEMNTNQLKQIIENTLDDEEKDYGEIEQINKNSKVITIQFDDIENRDKFMKYTKENHTNWICEIPILRNPCIRIGGVIIKKSNTEEEINWEAWLEKIKNKNKWIPQTKDSVFKINFKTIKHGKWNIVLEVTPNIRQAIIRKQGKIYSGLQKHEVYDNFNILTCYNCSTYGHTTNQCGQQPICNYCSKQHYSTCPVQNDKTKQKCPACRKNGHSFNDPCCTEFIWRLNHELQFINMNYDIIMTPKK